MSFVLTYASLLANLRTYLERGNSVTHPVVFAQLPQLVAFAEKRCAKELKLQGFEKYVYWAMQAGVYVYSKPDLWRETRSIQIGTNATAGATGYTTRKVLYPRELEYCRSYWPNPVQTGEPLFYAEYGPQHILIAPTPAEAFPSEWAYWQLPQPLDDQNQANWLTMYAPELLLYACLLEAQPFLKNDERIPVWQGMYDRAAAALRTQDARKTQDAAVQPEEGIQ